MVSQSKYIYKIRLDSAFDVLSFVRTASKIPYELTLVNGKHRLNAKSYLGVILAKASWDEVYVECEVDCYFDLENFIE